jgi:hypothetical protein
MSLLIYSAIVFVPPLYCEMDVLKEQRVCIKFCQKLGKTATEMYEMLQQAFGETASSWSKIFEWYSRFKNGRTSIDDDPHTGGHQRREGSGTTHRSATPSRCSSSETASQMVFQNLASAP